MWHGAKKKPWIIMSDFKSLNLHPAILKELEVNSYVTPTPIQAKAIPHLLNGKDLLGIAQTGTGKTASFSLPMINRFASNPIKLEANHTRAVVMAPTRELATQIHQNIAKYTASLDISSTVIIGGVRKENQIEEMKKGVDIVVGTPGRLMDLMHGGNLLFNQLEVFVLDEADMMLDMGFFEDVKVISSRLPEIRQNILFSATMPAEIEALAKGLLIKPVKVAVAPESTTVDTVDQKIYFVEENDKYDLLSLLLNDESIERALIFCKAKYGVANVIKVLDEKEITSGEIHSNRTQSQRDQAIADFTEGKIRVLVATDIASRGIDVKGVSHVINFNLPEDATYYVHRIGRTGRAGKEGTAISLCGERDLSLLRNIKKLIKVEIPSILDHPFHKEFPPISAKKRSQGPRSRNRKRPSQAKRRAKQKFIENL